MTKAELFPPLAIELDSLVKKDLYVRGFRCFAQISKPFDVPELHQIARAMRQFHGETILIMEEGCTTFWAIPAEEMSDRITLVHNEVPTRDETTPSHSHEEHELDLGSEYNHEIESLAPPIGDRSPIDTRTTVPSGPPEPELDSEFPSQVPLLSERNSEHPVSVFSEPGLPEFPDAEPVDLRKRITSRPPPPLPVSNPIPPDLNSDPGIPVSTRDFEPHDS